MFTKAQLRSVVRGLMGDRAQTLWHDSALDVLIEVTLDEMWGELLDASPQLVSKLEVISNSDIAAPGYIDTKSLDERLYRVTKLTRDSQEYKPADTRDVVIQDSKLIHAPHRSYTLFGDQLWVFPLDATSTIELRYNYLPKRFTELVDNDVVPWLSGYYAAPVFEIAGRALAHNETGERLLVIADRSIGRARAAAERRLGHMGIYLPDSPIQWGGV